MRAVTLPCEVLVVYDMPEDTTVPYIEKAALADSRVRGVLNTYGRGPANAIRFGFAEARSPVTVVTMADGSDDPMQIDELARLVERGVVVAAASRYMPGGQQVGGPRLKRVLSRTAGKSLHMLARVGTRDATNSFKAYSTDFVRQVGIDSRTMGSVDHFDFNSELDLFRVGLGVTGALVVVLGGLIWRAVTGSPAVEMASKKE